ncbi:MMS1-N domain containing protein [Pyrenophora tritici-repentis]|nr:MMS1-N domain containing protein [Pyrenophora tritici-repentis]
MEAARGLILVDGEWVSRPLDPYHIMASARQDDTEMRDAVPKTTTQVPEYGILSQTVISTPLNKLILPANIRHKDLTDIVMVGEDAIHIKEICDYGHVRHVASKTDFSGGHILAAKVFGDPREIPKSKGAGFPMSKDHMKMRPRKLITGEEENLLPPEVVVLTLTNRTLMFLWARQMHTAAARFCHKTLRLPAGSTRLDRLGSFLAIDPKFRAIAVAAHEGRFILYKTKSMERWRGESKANNDITTPIEDERIISLEGQIMHMDFLSSGAQDEFHVVLLFVVVVDGKTKLTCFDWDCRQDLSKVTARTERHLVQDEDMMPSLLIPLRRSPDFLLVSNDHISVYKNILSGYTARTLVPIDENILCPLLPGDSKTLPRWTAWDEAPRNPEYQKEAFYIAREDGRIMYVVRGPANTVELDEAGEWSYRIDTAFACLSMDNSEASQQYPDILVAGGAGNDGLLCKVGSWPAEYSHTVQYPGTNQFSYVESIPNWTPLTDLAVTQLSSPRASDERQRSSIFVANGNSPHGEISELRHGVQAVVDDSFSGINGCAGIWVVDHGSHMVDIEGTMKRQHYAIFVITLPPETLVIRVVRTQPESRAEFSGAWEQGSWDKFQTPSEDDPLEDDVMRDEETISACTWSDRISIQITSKEARTLVRPTLRLAHSLEFDTSLLLAASRTGCPFVAIAFREGGVTFLEVIPISTTGAFEKANSFRHKLAYDPTCIEILGIGGFQYVFVSTFDSKILLFKHYRGETSRITELNEDAWHINSGNSQKLCESAAVLSCKGRHVLVCGMRDGFLWSSNLEVGEDGLTSLSSWTAIQMGATSAKVTRSETDASAAFVSCGSDFCRVRCSAAESSDIQLDSIWFTDRAHPEYNQSPVSAMYQLPFLQNSDVVGQNLGGFLFAVAGDRLLFSQLDSDVKWPTSDVPPPVPYDARAVPRKLVTGAKPTNILYMQKLRRVLVSTMEAKEKHAPPHGERVLESSIKLLRVRDDRPQHDTDIKQEEEVPAERLVVAQCSLLNAERVYSMVEWQFVNEEGKRYSFIIVGTGIQISSTSQSGRRLIFNTGKHGSKLEQQKASTYSDPIYSIALWDNQTIISIIGKTLSIDRFSEPDGRWYQRGKLDLPSPGVHVSVNRPFIYVSTLKHSHLCYRVSETTRPGYFDLALEFSDSAARSCARHLVMEVPNANVALDNNRFVLLTDKNSGSITGLYQPPALAYSNASATLFEACLPRSVVRLDRGDIRPPWRRPNPNGKVIGVLADDIIGACTDGTIFALAILSQPARHLLRLLQNLIEVKATRSGAHQHATVKPRSGDIFKVLMNNTPGNQHGGILIRDVDPRHLEQNSQRGQRHKHIDGDLLKRWLDEGGDVEGLVWDDADAEIGALFKDLALDVEGTWGVRSAGKGKDRQENRQMYGFVRRWMKDVLMPVL